MIGGDQGDADPGVVEKFLRVVALAAEPARIVDLHPGEQEAEGEDEEEDGED